MNRFIEKINFKRVVVIYLVLLVIAFLGIGCFLGRVYQDKIKTWYYYHQLMEEVEEEKNNQGNMEVLKKKISDLQDNSEDIVDMVLISNNEIIYRTKEFYQNDLVSYQGLNNYYVDSKENVYKLDTSKEYILELFGFQKEDKNDYYNRFLIGSSKDKTYVVTYKDSENKDERVVIVSKINLVKKGKFYVKISLAILLLFFMSYWFIVVLMVYQNALKLGINAKLWGGVTLLTNLVGVFIYLIYLKRWLNLGKESGSKNSKDGKNTLKQ